MKQKLIVLFTTVIILFVTTSQVSAPKQEEKSLTVTLTDKQWGVVMFVISKSEASHTVVDDVQQGLYKQLWDTTLQNRLNPPKK